MNKEVHFVIDKLDSLVNRAVEDKPFAHLPFRELDALIGGVKLGRLVILSGEPGAGKTTLVHQIADSLAEQGHPVLYFSYEMPPSALVAKSLVRLSNNSLTIRDINHRDDDPFVQQELNEAIKRYKNAASNLALISTSKPCTTTDIGVMVGNCEGRFNKKPIVIVDYLQIVPTDSDLSDERLQVKEVVSALRRIAVSHDVPIFAISSVNRSSYNKTKVGLDSLGSSSFIEYSADSVLFLSIEGKGEERIVNSSLPIRPVCVSVLKNRYSSVGEARFLFEPSKARFLERPTDG